jgi:hypothetical protein
MAHDLFSELSTGPYAKERVGHNGQSLAQVQARRRRCSRWVKTSVIACNALSPFFSPSRAGQLLTDDAQTLVGNMRISPPPPGGPLPSLSLKSRPINEAVCFVSFAHRPRVSGGAFYDYTARYGAVRDEVGLISQRVRLFCLFFIWFTSQMILVSSWACACKIRSPSGSLISHWSKTGV